MRQFTFTDRTGEKDFVVLAANWQIAVDRVEKDTGLLHSRKEFQYKHECHIPLGLVVVLKNELT